MARSPTARLEARITRIKSRLAELGDMTPGSLSTQYNVCGNPTCKCKDPVSPKRHGPYYQLSLTRKGKSKTRFVKQEELAMVRAQIKNYAKFKELIDEWIEIALELSALKRRSV
jgi:hypothetical protein